MLPSQTNVSVSASVSESLSGWGLGRMSNDEIEAQWLQYTKYSVLLLFALAC